MLVALGAGAAGAGNYGKKERAVSKINQEQELLLEKTGVDLSLCRKQIPDVIAPGIHESSTEPQMRQGNKT